MEMVVAKMYQLARLNGKYSKEHKELRRSRVVITRDYAEGINNDYKNNGKLYEIDEEATIEYHKIGKQRQSENLEAKQNADILTEMANEITNTVKKSRKKK